MTKHHCKSHLVDEATAAFESFDYARAVERTESWFWAFCDDYLELVKGRAYTGDASAAAALTTALETLLKLFAPFLPYATEEVWSWWRDGSVHRSSWPSSPAAGAGAGGEPAVLAVAADVLGQIRKAKSDAKRSMRTEVTRCVVRDTPERVAALRLAEGDVAEAGRVAELVVEETSGEGAPGVEVTLAAE
jgi:valyl-tRNA synthetase